MGVHWNSMESIFGGKYIKRGRQKSSDQKLTVRYFNLLLLVMIICWIIETYALCCMLFLKKWNEGLHIWPYSFWRICSQSALLSFEARKYGVYEFTCHKGNWPFCFLGHKEILTREEYSPSSFSLLYVLRLLYSLVPQSFAAILTFTHINVSTISHKIMYQSYEELREISLYLSTSKGRKHWDTGRSCIM
jgi:hypothetical protein